MLTAIAVLVLFGLVTRRLRRMTAVVQRFEHGDYDERVAEMSHDEVGQLAASFNAMADTIVANLEELKRNDHLRRELVANVSHDLRSPLASIQGYLETVLMKQDELSAEERARFLETALRNANRLSALVAELFDLSKFDAQQIEPRMEAFSVAELVQDVVAQFQPRIFERFYRGDEARSAQSVQGAGLGLAIAEQILVLHGGTISVESEPGYGATFAFDLTLAQPSATPGGRIWAARPKAEAVVVEPES